MNETQSEDTERLKCDVNDCMNPALAKVFPTHGQTEHSALRCRKCLEYDLDRRWFREWGKKIAHRNTQYGEPNHD